MVVVLVARWIALVVAAGAGAAHAAETDWPMWRHDAARTAACDGPLGDDLHLHWVRRLPAQRPAWKDEGGMQFDRSYRPIALGGLLLVASTVNDRLTAYALDNGAERWRFYAEGPIRVAPAAWRSNVYAASDDGLLYCLSAADGRVKWTFRGGPSGRRLIGNERLISTWPARGGPAVADGVVYVTAGVWPFMGTFVHALDAETGRVLWTNDGQSWSWRRFPHPGSWALSGLSPQGHLAVAGERLIVPGSRYMPGVFDRRTGAFCFYGEGRGPHAAAASFDGKRFAFTGGRTFDVDTGYEVRLKSARRVGRCVLARDVWHTRSGDFDPASVRVAETTIHLPETTAPDGPTYPKQIFAGDVRKLAGRRRATPWIRAGGKLVAASKDRVQVYDAGDRGDRPQPLWQVELDAPVGDVLAAGGRLIVVSEDGSIYCFAPAKRSAKTYGRAAPRRLKPNRWADEAAAVLKIADARAGYALVWGLKDGGLVEELIRQSDLHVVAVDADAKKVAALRRRLDDAGLYGARAAALIARPTDVVFAPYLASMIASEDASAAGLGEGAAFASKLFHPLRPYGGTACLPMSAAEHERFAASAGRAQLAGAEVKRVGQWTVLRRAGPLAGSAPWRGQNADAGNTRCSRDRRVRAPLGVLWFGNALSNRLVLPKHGEGPVEQVVGGRLFIEGPDGLTAVDVYTGRVLWTRSFPELGRYYVSTKHQRGAHSIGSNFYAAADAVYVSFGRTCYVLDPATGRTRRQLGLPGGGEWQFLLVCDDLLIAGVEPVIDVEQSMKRVYSPTSSRGLAVMDRRSGKLLWTRKARYSFRHYGICAGRGKVFCIDRLSVETLRKLARRGAELNETPRIYALDARTGKVLWQSEQWAGEQLSYSAEHDILVADAALRGADGRLVWQNPELEGILWGGKWGLMIRGRTILPQVRRAIDLLSGRLRTCRDAAGVRRVWRYARSHGCGPMAGSEHLVAFRSACAGFLDLERYGGTGNLGGFRSGCTSNLIAADGVLNAPDYTRACTCLYQNRSSLAFVHMPRVEYWTFGAYPRGGRVAVNFGAPGDRRDDRGTLWLDWPAVGGPSFDLPVTVWPKTTRFFRHHAWRIQGGDGRAHAWVAASGALGAREIAVTLVPGVFPRGRAAACTVRLHFAETQAARPGERVFSVALQGRTVLEGLDIACAAGGPNRGIVREVTGVAVKDVLTIALTPNKGSKPTFLCGVEIEK